MRTITDEQLAANEAEAEAFAHGVFARMAAAGVRNQPRARHTRNRTEQKKEKQQWFSGVEAAVPNGDRE